MLKINSLYNNILCEEQTPDEYDELDKIISFVSTPIGENIQQQIEQSLEQTLNDFKQKFPEFKNVELYFDIDEFEYEDVYAEVFPEDLQTIRINLFPFLQRCYYGQFSKKFSLNKMLEQIKNGTYDDMNGPLIAHELAHIADLKNHKDLHNVTDVHGSSFYTQLQRLSENNTLKTINEEFVKIPKIPKVLYHATYKPLIKSIKRNGLGNTKRHWWDDSKRNVVYLADDIDIAISYAEANEECDEEWLDQIVVLKINSDMLDHDRLYKDENVLVGDDQDESHTYEYHGIIPGDILEIVQNGTITEGTLKHLMSILQDSELRFNFNHELCSSPNYKDLTDDEKRELDDTIEYFSHFYQDTMNKVTDNPQYQSWVYDMLIKGDIQPEYFLTEYYTTVKRVLDQFVILCRSPKISSDEKNIQNYSSFYKLEQFIKKHIDLLTKQIKLTCKKVYSNDMFDIYEVNESDKQLFQQLYGKVGYDCGWCVVNPDRNEFEKYLNDGDPHYYLWTYKGTNKPFALYHGGSEQFKDIHNKTIMRQDVSMHDDVLYNNVLDGLKFLIKNHIPNFLNDLSTYRSVLK